MRESSQIRETTETKIKLSLQLDEGKNVSVQTGVGFFDHMLTLFARHGRFGLQVEAMDESLGFVAIDISGRSYIVFQGELTNPKLGDFDTELTEEFFRAVAHTANITLHARILYGSNTHHKIEALFKAFGRALREAVERNAHITGVNSTKGML